MTAASAWTMLLFSYGTLQNKAVQIANFGRELKGRADALPGYVPAQVPIANPNIAAAAGRVFHANVVPSSDPRDVVPGMVYEVTERELLAADRYEQPADYRRICVTLGSGDRAWVYVYRP